MMLMIGIWRTLGMRILISRRCRGAPSMRNASGASGVVSRDAANAVGYVLLHSHVTDQTSIDIHPRIEHQAVLCLLQLMQEEHHEDAGDQCGQRGVERHAQSQGHSRDVAMHRSLGFL